MKGSKWQYIRDKCIEMDYTESAKIAQEIEDALVEAYGISSTPTWRAKGAKTLNLWSLHDVILKRSFCRGCVETDKIDAYCFGCKYGRKKGVCGDQRSQFAKFMCTYEEEEQCHKENKQNKGK